MPMFPFCFCDIDHVLADSFWRDKYISEDHHSVSEDDFSRYHQMAAGDTPIKAANLLLQSIAHKYRLVFVTSRPEDIREETTLWLNKAGFYNFKLLMRPSGDRRSSPKLKIDLIREYKRTLSPSSVFVDSETSIIIDDRLDVLIEAADIGLTTLMFSSNEYKNDVKGALRIHRDEEARKKERAKAEEKAKAEANRATGGNEVTQEDRAV